MRSRSRQSGFTLLETLVAFGLLTMVLAMALPALSGAAARQAGRLHRLQAAEFAVSLLTEYRYTWPLLSARGSDESGWHWQIIEQRVAPDGATSLDGAMHLVELRLEVWHRDRPEDRRPFSTLAARPGP